MQRSTGRVTYQVPKQGKILIIMVLTKLLQLFFYAKDYIVYDHYKLFSYNI